MPTWNELFGRESFQTRVPPELEVHYLVGGLAKLLPDGPLCLWDLCCGGGRNTVYMAGLGHRVYASDKAPSALDRIREWLADLDLSAQTALADMTVCPWEEAFHGVVRWDALHHNTFDQVQEAVATVRRHLVPRGLFLVTL